MLSDKMEHCIVFMNSWDVSGAFWSFSKCKSTIPHLPADPSNVPSIGIHHGVHAPCRGSTPLQPLSTYTASTYIQPLQVHTAQQLYILSTVYIPLQHPSRFTFCCNPCTACFTAAFDIPVSAQSAVVRSAQ
jgi:hypothetical protein